LTLLAVRGHPHAAQEALAGALDLYERKGNLVAAGQVRAALAPSASV
jgi:hypothetical protein